MRHPLLIKSGQVVFCPLYRTWSLIEKAVRLIKFNNELSWSVSSPTAFDVVRPFKQSTIPSMICHEDTDDLIEKLKMGIDSEVASCLDKDFIVTRVLEEHEINKECKERKKLRVNEPRNNSILKEAVPYGYTVAGFALGKMILQGIGIKLIQGTALSIIGPGIVGVFLPIAAYEGYKAIKNVSNIKESLTPTSSIEKQIFIEIEPFSVKSRIDERAMVSKFTWSVTVITGPEGPAGNHTSILIEGIDSSNFSFGATQGQYFMCQAHWVPPIKTRFINDDKFKYWLNQGIRRSHIFMRSSQKVSQMLTQILKERDEHSEIIQSGKQVQWTRWGKYSKYGNGTHNCMTWAMEKLAFAEIHLHISKNPYVIIIPSMYTKHPLEFEEPSLFTLPYSPQI